MVAEGRDDLRAADSDRQFVADRLRTALNEGRLDLSEYDERLQRAYAAKTYGELDRVLDDLPRTASPEQSAVAPAAPGPSGPSGAQAGYGTPVPPAAEQQRRKGRSPLLLAMWGGWLSTTLICMVIYVASDFGGYPWPVWVAGPWGAILLGRTIMAYASGDPHTYLAAEQERQQQRKDRERDRRQDRWERHQDRWDRRRDRWR
ncbi:DUF1707 SHOCT-like domain-containing protein [Rugosimonospora africana]|uniref:DUF1707 domain-containing protein n=1 Tax=Rugosimonospora africana TaxID=556532 RepID=A0A8J3VNG6_9ACTN|nr:DUF1707 domain-containing protein [Rugosimonospora africana]GIH12208.1 hypothetical protein Raf01_03800 [Rugosimonospora africana]